jgi:hypothetical protein
MENSWWQPDMEDFEVNVTGVVTLGGGKLKNVTRFT